MLHDVAPRVCAWCNFYPDAEPREEFEARVLPLLELAFPVFRSGVETLRRTAAVRAEFFRRLDVGSDGFMLVDGAVMYCTRIRRSRGFSMWIRNGLG